MRDERGPQTVPNAQFLHIETYGPAPKKNAAHHQTISGILGEAARRPSSCQHIATPQRPNRLLGPDPLELIATAKALHAAARDSRGRKLSPRAGVLVAIVASYPIPRDEISNAADRQLYQTWLAATRDWLIAQFEDRLYTVLEHVDERQFHLHAYAFPGLDAKGQLDWTHCHPGRAARQMAARNGEKPSHQNQAYNKAMRALLDDYHRFVSAQFGHARVTTRRDRRSRAHHLEVARLNQHSAALAAENETLRNQNTELRQTIDRLRAAGATISAHPTLQAPNADCPRVTMSGSAPTPVAAHDPALRPIEAENHRSDRDDSPPANPDFVWEDMPTPRVSSAARKTTDKEDGERLWAGARKRQGAELDRLFSPQTRDRLRANRSLFPGRGPVERR